MIVIAHRGLIDGPNPSIENRPDTIQKALALGFDVEIDLHVDEYDKLWLGHDRPEYPITPSFLNEPRLWIHAKTLKAAYYCSSQPSLAMANWFFHQNDDCTVVRSYSSFIWTYPDKNNTLYQNSIAVLPELIYSDKEIKALTCSGICTDFANKFRKLM